MEQILGNLEVAELNRGSALIEEIPQNQEAALRSMSDIKKLIQDSSVRKIWVTNPEPVFREAISRLRKLNGLWAQNLASYLQLWLKPSPVL
jgi:hypothetical protein